MGDQSMTGLTHRRTYVHTYGQFNITNSPIPHVLNGLLGKLEHPQDAGQNMQATNERQTQQGLNLHDPSGLFMSVSGVTGVSRITSHLLSFHTNTSWNSCFN